MPGFVAIPDTVKVAMEGQEISSARPFAMVWAVKLTSPATATDCANIGNVFYSDYAGAYGSWPDTIFWDQIVCTALDTAGSPQTITGVNHAGTGGVGYANMAGVIDLECTERGRSFRGRHYNPIPEGQTNIDSGTVTSGWTTGFAGIMTTLIADLLALPKSPVVAVASRKLGLSTPATSILVREGLGFIRRRLDG